MEEDFRENLFLAGDPFGFVEWGAEAEDAGTIRCVAAEAGGFPVEEGFAAFEGGEGFAFEGGSGGAFFLTGFFNPFGEILVLEFLADSGFEGGSTVFQAGECGCFYEFRFGAVYEVVDLGEGGGGGEGPRARVR